MHDRMIRDGIGLGLKVCRLDPTGLGLVLMARTIKR